MMTPKNTVLLVVAAVTIIGGAGILLQRLPGKTPPPILGGAMTLTSAVFQHNGSIPAKYTCDGENVSPPLSITGAPSGTQSFVLIVDDPDAPRGDWVHWTVWNIPPNTSNIGEASVPPGALEGMTDFNTSGYGGPCPPSGTHRYQFKLYALDTSLTLDPSARKSDIERAMEGHVLRQTLLVGLYARRS